MPSAPKMTVKIDGNSLTITQLVEVAQNGKKISLSKESREKVKNARLFLETLVHDKKVVYGVTTGFGELCYKLIPKKNILNNCKKIL
tara:strand:- start:2530 stop:2790 length:261 start_codon:yes stop_codon:yes gene_type:complete